MSSILRRVLAVSLAAACLPTAAAVADGPITTTLTTTTTTTSPAPAPPAKGSVRLYLPDVFVVAHQAVSVPGRRVTVSGVVRPYVAGQWVTVKAYVGRRLIRRANLRVRPSRSHRYGRFSLPVVSPSAGVVRIEVSHARSSGQAGFRAIRRYGALDEHIGFGSTGRFVQLMQQRLAAAHMYLRQTGVYDSGMGLAIDAYHRLLRWGTSQYLGGATISALLNGRGRFAIRFPGHGHHAEGNLRLQLLALTDGSQVRWIFPISSGKPSTPTVLGDFRIYRRTPGYLPDGMYYSSFFTGGYAIHGFDPAPDYPASHGCMRLPIQDAIPAYYWLGYGDWVDVYY